MTPFNWRSFLIRSRSRGAPAPVKVPEGQGPQINGGPNPGPKNQGPQINPGPGGGKGQDQPQINPGLPPGLSSFPRLGVLGARVRERPVSSRPFGAARDDVIF